MLIAEMCRAQRPRTGQRAWLSEILAAGRRLVAGREPEPSRPTTPIAKRGAVRPLGRSAEECVEGLVVRIGGARYFQSHGVTPT